MLQNLQNSSHSLSDNLMCVNYFNLHLHCLLITIIQTDYTMMVNIFELNVRLLSDSSPILLVFRARRDEDKNKQNERLIPEFGLCMMWPIPANG